MIAQGVGRHRVRPLQQRNLHIGAWWRIGPATVEAEREVTTARDENGPKFSAAAYHPNQSPESSCFSTD